MRAVFRLTLRVIAVTAKKVKDVDWHSSGRVGAICGFKMLNVCLFEGNINSDVFYAWLTKELFFSIPEKAVIVLDNATFHKRSDSIQAIHTVLFLPPYSPDLNPIEKKWAQAKNIRKKHRCSPYELFKNFVT